MGKLHSLRRAIQRNPELWKSWKGDGHYWRSPPVCGAHKRKGQWEPRSWSNSYRYFVASVLRELEDGLPR